jgi:Spy/CpxP family protein refolding chaperone
MRRMGLVAIWILAATAVVASAASPRNPVTGAARTGVQMHESASSLDLRVRRLAKALDLNPAQQTQLRAVLLKQEAQVKEAWSDTSVPSSYRVLATRIISDQTADRIRALLNDEQRKKYNPPRLAPTSHGPPGTDVERWLSAMQSK